MKANDLSGQKVWIAETCYDYEGCDLLGVFATRRRAEKAFEAVHKRPIPWVRNPFGSHFSKGEQTSLNITAVTVDRGQDDASTTGT